MVMAVLLVLHPRLVQMCINHEMLEKRFFEQANKAGKDDYLRRMKDEDLAGYLALLKEFADTSYLAKICSM